ncbi:hypothetical protein [Kangiella sp. TOML190]|uniref:hypothetical protein n=1 Tax=Kangiella sp. TOML190 TaxID=2931351 RepID=UPI0020405407|nr:hypothetical protein [Kangiella sp. TOML190]
MDTQMESQPTPKPPKMLLDWSAVVWAGVITGVLSLPLLFFVLPALINLDTSSIIQYWASMLLGSSVISVPASFSIGHLLVAIVTHVALTLLLTTIIASIFHRFGTLIGITGGALVGLAYYLINIYSMTYFFSWMYLFEGAAFLLFNMLIGGMAGFFYESLEIEQWQDSEKFQLSSFGTH